MKPQIKMFGLIRDKNGKPKIDGDPNDMADAIKELLTETEKKELFDGYHTTRRGA